MNVVNRILVRKVEGMKPLEKNQAQWMDNIVMGLVKAWLWIYFV
jgi:hypothetical protein